MQKILCLIYLKKENKKLNVETYLIDIEEINAGVTNSLAGKNEFKKKFVECHCKENC